MLHFKNLYIADIEEVSDKVEDSFLMCGKNWDFYFTSKDDKADFEVLENIKYVEFDNKKDFDNFVLNNEVIDYSIESNKSMAIYNG